MLRWLRSRGSLAEQSIISPRTTALPSSVSASVERKRRSQCESETIVSEILGGTLTIAEVRVGILDLVRCVGIAGLDRGWDHRDWDSDRTRVTSTRFLRL